MGSPSNPVTLTAQQVEDLNKQLSTLRHNINNQLALIVAAVELLKVNPQSAPRMIVTLGEQPPKIAAEIKRFSAVFEEVFGVNRPSP